MTSRIEKFVRLWNEKLAVTKIMAELSFKSPESVRAEASRLRRLGYRLIKRPRKPGRPILRRAPRNPGQRYGLSQDLLLGRGFKPATIMDANGKTVGKMDPLTRQRTPIG